MAQEFELFSGFEVCDAKARGEIEKLKTKKITIMIGDSYGEGANADVNWSDLLANKLKLNLNETYFKNAKGGAGFVTQAPNGKIFLNLLEDISLTTEQKNNVDRIIVCGGYNDINQTFSTIIPKIQEFCEYCKSNFPNAEIYCGMIGNNSTIDEYNNYTYSNIRQKLIDTITPSYQAISKYGGIYLNGVETCLKDYRFMGEDKYHPNNEGQYSLAELIYQCLKIGNGYIFSDTENAQLYEAENGQPVNNQIKIFHSGGSTRIMIPFLEHTFSIPVNLKNGVDFRLFGIDTKLLRNQYMINIPIMCTVNGTEQLHGKLYLSMDNKLVLRVNKNIPTNISTITIYPEEFNIPTKYC